MKKEINLENLAQMIASGFADVDKNFISLEKRLNRRIDKLESTTNRRFLDIEQRLINVESDVKDIKYNRMQYAYVTDVMKLEKRVEKLEKKVG